jgi:hypothetical protein
MSRLLFRLSYTASGQNFENFDTMARAPSPRTLTEPQYGIEP